MKLTPEQRDELTEVVSEVVNQFGDALIDRALKPLADRLIALSRELQGEIDRLRELYADLATEAAKPDEADWWKAGPPDEAD